MRRKRRSPSPPFFSLYSPAPANLGALAENGSRKKLTHTRARRKVVRVCHSQMTFVRSALNAQRSTLSQPTNSRNSYCFSLHSSARSSVSSLIHFAPSPPPSLTSISLTPTTTIMSSSMSRQLGLALRSVSRSAVASSSKQSLSVAPRVGAFAPASRAMNFSTSRSASNEASKKKEEANQASGEAMGATDNKAVPVAMRSRLNSRRRMPRSRSCKKPLVRQGRLPEPSEKIQGREAASR